MSLHYYTHDWYKKQKDASHSTKAIQSKLIVPITTGHHRDWTEIKKKNQEKEKEKEKYT